MGLRSQGGIQSKWVYKYGIETENAENSVLTLLGSC